jgi:hypothetical protein
LISRDDRLVPPRSKLLFTRLSNIDIKATQERVTTHKMRRETCINVVVSPDAERHDAAHSRRRTHCTRSLATICTRQPKIKAGTRLLARISTSMQKILGTGAAAFKRVGSGDQGRVRARRRGACKGCARERRSAPAHRRSRRGSRRHKLSGGQLTPWSRLDPA